MALGASALVVAPVGPAVASGDPHLSCDIDNDGYGDLIVGIPGEDLGSAVDAGAVQIFFGTVLGITADRNMAIGQHHPSIPGGPENDDAFGLVSECGDFDGDGYDDVVVGVPFEDVGTRVDAGLVTVIPGSPSGPRLDGAFNIHQGSPGVPGAVEAGDRFGLAVAPGDFDGDGYDDLAVGSAGEDLGSIENAGMVHVFSGGPDGLELAAAQTFTQRTPGVAGSPEPHDFFGSQFTTGDLDLDGRDELVLGLPHEDIGSLVDAGMVTVLWGSSAGVTGTASTTISQKSARIPGGAEAGDQFGEALTVYRHTIDDPPLLAVGVPYEDIGDHTDIGLVQSVAFVAGDAVDGGYHLATGVDLVEGRDDLQFGISLATSTRADGLGEPGETFAAGMPGYHAADLDFIYPFAGMVAGDLAPGGRNGRNLSHEFVSPYPEAGAAFGLFLISNDYDGDGVGDLAAGAPFFDFNNGEFVGLVTVIDGAFPAFSERWHQRRPGVVGGAESDDLFGFLGGNP